MQALIQCHGTSSNGPREGVLTCLGYLNSNLMTEQLAFQTSAWKLWRHHSNATGAGWLGLPMAVQNERQGAQHINSFCPLPVSGWPYRAFKADRYVSSDSSLLYSTLLLLSYLTELHFASFACTISADLQVIR